MNKNDSIIRKDWIDIQYQSAVGNISTNNIKIKQKEYLTDGAFPVIDQGSDLIGGYTNDVTKVIDCSLPAIVFGDHTKIVKLIKQKFAPGADGIKVLVPHKFFDPRLFTYLTQVLTRKIPSKGYARHFQYLTKSNIPLPPLPEQRAIVAKIEQLFSDLDNGIANLKQAREQLKVYRQAVLKKAFEGELTKEWREKQTNLPSAEELLEQIKAEREKHYAEQLESWTQSVSDWEAKGKPGKKPAKPKKPKELPLLTKQELAELPELPNLWLYTHLANSGELARGKSKHRPRKDKKLFGGDYPFVQTGEVKAANGIITDYTKTYNDFGLSQSKLWAKGTLCITIAANIAETAFLGFDACFPDSIVGFTAYSKVINEKYVDYFFQASKQRITAFAPATAQKNINLETLENLLIPYTSIVEQEQIVSEIESRLSVCDNVEANIEAALQQSEALRQSILKKAFEGKLLTESELAACRLEPDYEPAEKLLQRIKTEKKGK